MPFVIEAFRSGDQRQPQLLSVGQGRASQLVTSKQIRRLLF